MKELKTVDIKGKSYVMVNERIAYFREIYPDGSIITELLSTTDGVHTIKATAINNGIILATGHASEKDGSSFINKTSALENAETSAVGRCLGILGIGIDASVASAEEVGNAVKQQENESITVNAKELSCHLENLAISTNIESLKIANTAAYNFAKGDQVALIAVLQACKTRKKELTEND